MKTSKIESVNKNTEMPTIHHVVDITVKSPDDEIDCGITGCVVMPNSQLIVTDYDNEKLKVVDTEHNELIEEMTLTSGPTDVTKICDNQYAIALPDESKILLVDTEPELSVQREISVSGKCWGVSHSGGKLIVTIQEPDKLEIMDKAGAVLNSIESNGDDDKLCNPESASISPDGEFIYVSNYGNETIVKLDWNGNTIASYSDGGLKYPGNVVFDVEERMFVCGYVSNTLHLVSQDGEMFQELLGKSDGLDRPACLAYDTATNRLYIGMKANNMKVFQLSCG